MYIIDSNSPVKMVDEKTVAGYLVRFTNQDNPDLVGDFFTANTDFDLIEQPARRGVYYNHGLDAMLKNTRIGVGEIVQDDVGLWITAQLSIRDRYEEAVLQLLREGKLGWSSGTAPFLVEKMPFGKAHFIKKWVIAEASLTPIPAEPRNYAEIKFLGGVPLETHTNEAITMLDELIERFNYRKSSREREGRDLSEAQLKSLRVIAEKINILTGAEEQSVFNTKLRDELLKLEAEFIAKKNLRR